MGEPDWSELSMEELLARARAGEKAALEELFRRCQPKLAWWALQHAQTEAPSGNRPSDIAQVSALRAFEKLSSFQGSSEGELFAWLKRVVLSQAVQLAREARSQKRDGSANVSLDTDEAENAPAPQRSPSQHTSHQEEVRHLLTSFYRLPEDQREALSLFHLKELSVAEIAALMGKSKDAVASLMQRGLKTLKQRMDEAMGTASEDSPESAAVRNAADAALLTYFRRREAGEVLDPSAFAAEYPDCAEELRGLLHWIERLRAIKPPGNP